MPKAIRLLLKHEIEEKKDWEAISANWSSRAEAFSFWCLVLEGKLTAESAKKAILMTERQLRWLRHTWPLEATIFEEMCLRRIQTWKDFLYLCRHPEAAPEFQRPFTPGAGAAPAGGRHV